MEASGLKLPATVTHAHLSTTLNINGTPYSQFGLKASTFKPTDRACKGPSKTGTTFYTRF